MKYVLLAACIVPCVMIGSAHATQDQMGEQGSGKQSQSNVFVQESQAIDVSLRTGEKLENLSLDPIFTQAIYFSNAIGEWFEDLFDKKQNMSFNAHVNDLGKLLKAMQAAIVKPLVTEKNSDAIVSAAYNVTSILYARAEKTYSVLNEHRSSTSIIKIGNALKKIDKNFMSDQEKTRLHRAFKDLASLLIKSDAALCQKITKLESVVAENSTRTKQKGWWTLAWGLRHRLQCA